MPLGADNGSAIYTAVFTPNDLSLYAKVSADIAVNTQIGVNVSISPDDRDYIAGSAEATGIAALTDCDTGAPLADIALTGGSWSFSQIAPGDELTVTYEGYSLATPPGDENLYVLANTSATGAASIFWIIPALTAPTATMSFAQRLGDVELVGGSAEYNGAAIDGSWAWENESLTPSAVGEGSFYALFTPADTIGYKGGRALAAVKVEKEVVLRPMFAGNPYTGEKQYLNVSDNEYWTVTKNEGGVDVGEYEVILTLRDPDNYRWSGLSDSGADLRTSLIINPANIEVSGTPIVAHLGYGQRLTDKDDLRPGIWVTAAEMISGLSLELNGSPVQGRWVWNLTDELKEILNASDPSDAKTEGSGYTVSATFTASKNFNPVTRDFLVVVERSVPDLSDCTLSCSDIYLHSTPCVSLLHSKISCSGNARNPVVYSDISGYWAWPDSSRVPEKDDQEFNAMFVPYDDKNYLNAYKTVKVPTRDYVIFYVSGGAHPSDGGSSIANNDGSRSSHNGFTGTGYGDSITIRPYYGSDSSIHLKEYTLKGYFGGEYKNSSAVYLHRTQSYSWHKSGDVGYYGMTISDNGYVTFTFYDNYEPTGDVYITIKLDYLRE